MNFKVKILKSRAIECRKIKISEILDVKNPDGAKLVEAFADFR